MKWVPWITVLLLVVMIHQLAGTYALSEGTLIDLPADGLGDAAPTHLVALVQPLESGTLVFFDGDRYNLDDPHQLKAFGAHVADRVTRTSERTLLVLADRRVPLDRLVSLAATARRNGLDHLFVATRRGEAVE